MSADEQRIRQQDLRSRRGIMNIVEAHEGVAKERREQAANDRAASRGRSPPFRWRPQYDFALLLDMPLGPVAERERVLLDARERRSWQLDLIDSGRELA